MAGRITEVLKKAVAFDLGFEERGFGQVRTGVGIRGHANRWEAQGEFAKE